MPVKKIYIDGRSAVTLGCAQCGNCRTISASNINITRRPIRVKCSCGEVSYVIFEERQHYRKLTHLTGVFAKVEAPQVFTRIKINNLSKTGLGFSTLLPSGLKKDDLLVVEFTLDNVKRSLIKSNMVVRNVEGNYVGAEFCEMDEHTKKELGFYLLP